MPQFSVAVRDRDGVKHSINVWAETQREASSQALKMARKLLGDVNVELV
jgi:hypothetical protein